MPERAGRVLIIANLEKALAAETAEALALSLSSRGIASETYFVHGRSGRLPKRPRADLRRVARGRRNRSLRGPSRGSPRHSHIADQPWADFGFIAEIGRAEWPAAIDAWVDGKLPISERLMLSVEAWREGERLASFWAMNDATVSAQGIAKLIGFGIRMGKSSSVRYRADGVIVATPTGSTAYNLAAGGPVLHPEMEAMIVNPVCPFTLSNRPLVVPANEAVEITMEEGRRTGAMLTIDGQVTFTLRPGDRIRVSGAPKKARIHVTKGFEFYELLRTKLAWSGGPGA
jgi:NAD+ kinase